MSKGNSQRVIVRFRVFFVALIVPLTAATAIFCLGLGSARATQLLVHQPLSLHGGPDGAFSVLATLASGSKIDVLWCNAEASWCLVKAGEVQGWAPRADLIVRDASSNEIEAGKKITPGPASANGLVDKAGVAASAVGPTASPDSSGGATGGLHLSVSAGGVSAAASVQ